MIRGINQQDIFTDDEDDEKFLVILDHYRQKIEFELYAYCLMGNHVHLLLKEGKESLSNTIRRIGTSYVYYYNWQYDRKGHLFQDRYKSEPVEDDAYFLSVLRYIHQNPLKAGLTTDITSYPWSSYKEYIHKQKIVQVDFALSLFDQDKNRAIERFEKFNYGINQDQCLDITEQKKTLSDKMVRKLVLDKYAVELALLHNESKKNQLEIIKYLKAQEGISMRQLSRLTGLTLNRIFRI
jgi:REP element-mobilizing transposase RayT